MTLTFIKLFLKDARLRIKPVSGLNIKMANSQHVYGHELLASDPMLPQPEKILVELKAHQRAALAKAVVMECKGCVHYFYGDNIAAPNLFREPRIRGAFRAYSNVGILGDLVGHGKTLTALGIVASTPTKDIYTEHEKWQSYDTQSSYEIDTSKYTAGHVRIVSEPSALLIEHRMNSDMKYATTLIVVPRGPVFTQWKAAIESQTKLKYLVVDTIKCIKSKMPDPKCSSDELRAFYESLDCVIMKTSTLKQVIEYYKERDRRLGENVMPGFNRIIVDEAHDELGSIINMPYRFMWLVTSTYKMLCCKSFTSSRYISNGIRHLLLPEVMRTFVIRGADEFVRSSFRLPQMKELTYVCKMNMVVAALHSFLSTAVQERLNVNDIAGAVREMGGQAGTEEELVRMVTMEMDRNINNKRHEIDYTRHLEMETRSRETTLTRLDAELKRLEEKRVNLAERVTALENKQCAVCMDTYDEPVMLSCTHIFCGQCVVEWMRARARQSGHTTGCPTCREPINTNRMVAVVADGVDATEPDNGVNQNVEATNETDAAQVGKWKKEEMLVRLINRKLNGKWLVFTQIDNGFGKLKASLTEAGITFAELKGNTAVMANTMQRFRRGDVPVLLLHSQHAGSGIDISFATDVILFNSMGAIRTQCIGRAQRVGRLQPLTVHNLMYPHEVQ